MDTDRVLSDKDSEMSITVLVDSGSERLVRANIEPVKSPTLSPDIITCEKRR